MELLAHFIKVTGNREKGKKVKERKIHKTPSVVATDGIFDGVCVPFCFKCVRGNFKHIKRRHLLFCP